MYKKHLSNSENWIKSNCRLGRAIAKPNTESFGLLVSWPQPNLRFILQFILKLKLLELWKTIPINCC